ncbi:MAG: AraC family transcriptional regulator [Chitinophagaceae bacterium]|nr:MAG: AraC family transcriptional regulator [Chitinophagaceae bacterium]
MEDFQKKFILSLLAYASQRDVQPARLCELAGIDYKSLIRKTSGRLTPEKINSLWKNAAHLTSDPLFGLHLGEAMQLAALGVIGQIVQTSATVGEALSNAGALTPLITDMFQMRILHTKTNFRITFMADRLKADKFPSTYRHMSHFLVVFTVHELNGLLLEKMAPVQARFPIGTNDQLSYPGLTLTTHEKEEYQRVLRCKVSKREDETWIELPNRLLSQEILSANFELQNHLLNQVDILAKRDEADGSFHKKVYNYLLSNSFLYSLTLEAVAANFNMSVRSLQRRLKNEGITFLEIVDAVKTALAVTYLQSGNHAMKDIAYALGYNEQTAFVRAFKRWTGKTPVAYKTKTQIEK